MLRQGNLVLKDTLSLSLCRFISTSIPSNANHYGVLGITPKASQSEIKSAYYKLSKIYHPDKSTDEASAKKFRDITEAYEVLGNINLKNLYDKGLLIHKDPALRPSPMSRDRDTEPVDPSLKFYKSRSYRHAVPTMDGRKPIYNFDEWAKNHYSTLYEQSKYEKEFVKQRLRKQEVALRSHRQEIMMLLVFVLGGAFVMLVIQGTADYDQDMSARRKTKSVDT